MHLCRFASPHKQRPVLILTRLSALGHLSTVAPISSTIRDVPSEVILGIGDGMKGPCAVNLHNSATVSQDRFRRASRQPKYRTDARSLRNSAILARVRVTLHAGE